MYKLVIILCVILSLIFSLGLGVYACEDKEHDKNNINCDGNKISRHRTEKPTVEPTEEPTEEPEATENPTVEPTVESTETPEVTEEPSEDSTAEPTEATVVEDKDDDNNSDVVYESNKESLPKTGESGSNMLYIIGIIVTILGIATYLFVVKKREYNRN